MLKEGQFQDSKGYTFYTRSWLVEEPLATVYLHHGLGEHVARYDEMAAKFGEAGFEVHGFDARGFGGSSRLNPGKKAGHAGDWTQTKSDLKNFLKHFHSNKPKFLVSSSS